MNDNLSPITDLYQSTTPGMNYLEQDQLRRIVSNWKLTPATFAQKISRGSWIPSPHLQYVAVRIALAISKGNARIILSMPPRHGKSQLVSIYTPAWLLEYIGKLNIILACYGADLAEGFARQTRQIIADENNHDLLRVRLGDLRRSEAFSTSLGGYMYATGLGGTITGRGADVLLVDDYIKEIKEALSPAYRDYIWNWYVTTARTRLEPRGSIVIIATRWHSDDLIGRLLQNEGDSWEYIELPAIALDNDIIGRAPGEALFPERYPLDALHELKMSLGSIFFEALFQQRPVDESMRITDPGWLQPWPRHKPLPPMRLCRIWDLAATENGGDWMTGTLCGYNEESDAFIILDVERNQVGPGKIEAIVLATAEQDGYSVDIGIEQEPGSAGKILIQHYADNVLSDYRVEGITTGGKKKVVRAQPFLAHAEAGGVFYLEDTVTSTRKWNKAFKDEFECFPSTSHVSHDDMVDTAAEGYQKLTGRKPLKVSWGREEGIPRKAFKANAENSRKIRDAGSKIAQQSVKISPKKLIKGVTW